MNKTAIIIGNIEFTDPKINPNKRAIIHSVDGVHYSDTVEEANKLGIEKTEGQEGKSFFLVDDYKIGIYVKLRNGGFYAVDFLERMFLDHVETNMEYAFDEDWTNEADDKFKAIKATATLDIIKDAEFIFNHEYVDDNFFDEFKYLAADPHETKNVYKYWFWTCFLEKESYEHGEGLALLLTDANTGESVGDCSVNIDGANLKDDEFLVQDKCDNGHQTMLGFLTQNGIAQHEGKFYSGRKVVRLLV